ncbi:MAG TPA: NAD(P)/FAD-dependent oxidoreductase [Hyphomicrobiaceae bacterium]|nr:NAD(P)/FAD-dependent oxidoreductase [Hyphomicrobiaceae bacterium]
MTIGYSGLRQTPADYKVVICGGGSGGLDLACRLARKRDLDVTLLDPNATHVWKPLLHEVAAGSLDIGSHRISYLALARRNGFRFALGALEGLDRTSRNVLVAPVRDHSGAELIPQRRLSYDLAVIAVGAVSNDFGIDGVLEHAAPLDTASDAERIHQSLIDTCIRANWQAGADKTPNVTIAIVGGGATGVEFAAELREMIRALRAHGLDRLDPDKHVHITLINADPRLLPQLPERVSAPITEFLVSEGIALMNGEAVVRVGPHDVVTRSGKTILSELTVWAAGVKAPAVTRQLDGFETNRIGQLVVDQNLRSPQDPRLLAMGDCAAAPWPGHKTPVPPRAQAAQQQAVYLADAVPRMLSGRPLRPFRYRDLGSLVSLGSETTAIGTIMGVITGRSIRVEGLLARLFYKWLYKRHRAALFGWLPVLMESAGSWMGSATRPRIKLH